MNSEACTAVKKCMPSLKKRPECWRPSSKPANYRYLLPCLNQYDAIYAPLIPGHGTSVADFDQSNRSQWLAYVSDLCADLIKKYDKVDVMGLSLGGILACHLADKYPLNHLYLLAPALNTRLPLQATIRFARFMRALGFNRFKNAAGNLFSKDNYEISYRRLALNPIIETLTLIKEYNLNPPSCPCDLFLGKYDAVVDTTKIAARFEGLANIQIHYLPESAHVLPLDGNLQVIADCVQKNNT